MNQNSGHPKFEPDLPAHLLREMPASERWLYEQISVQSQQATWLIERAILADANHRALAETVSGLHHQVSSLELLRLMLGAKWKVILWLFSAIALPIVVGLAGHWFIERLSEK